MRQGSILAFLQPRATTDSCNLKSPLQESQVSRPIGASDTVPNTIHSNGDLVPSTTRDDPQPRNLIETACEGRPLSDPRAAITKVCPSQLDRLKSITATLLPVRYSDRFFTECFEADSTSVIAYAAIFDSRPVGWIRCRLEPFPNADNPAYQQIYVQALGILAPFRGIGLASALLKAAVEIAGDAKSIYAHVWETNEDALLWYGKHGFSRVLLVPQYYRRLKPSGAWLVRKELT